MLLGKKKELLAESDNSGTPKTSRKIMPFDKYVTAKDQIELIEKDIAGGFKFSVTRHRLSGGEQRGVLVVGVTAVSFLNSKEKIVFCHPYRVLSSYRVNVKNQLEYSLEIDKGKSLVYLFDTPEAAQIVASIDRSSLRLEKVIAAGNNAPSSSRGSDRAAQAAPFVDSEGQHAASSSGGAPVVGPKTKLGDIEGMRFNCRLKSGTSEQRVVAIVNRTEIIVVDPSADSRTGGTRQMACLRYPWSEVVSTSSSEKTVTVVTPAGSTVLHTPDARSLLDEIHRAAGQSGEVTGARDKEAATIAAVARMAVSHQDPKADMFGVLAHEAGGIKSKDMSPGAFAVLRRDKWKVQDLTYLEEWAPSDLLRRAELTPSLKGSKWVVHSKTQQFVAIELTKDEFSSFSKCVEPYYQHVQVVAPSSLLARIVGLHQSDNLYFMVVIRALAPQAPFSVTTYDLHADGKRVAPPAARGKTHAHLLDKDFLLDHQTVFTGYREKKKALVQLAQDASFLVKVGFSDFILQVSVGRFDEAQLPVVKAWMAAAEARGYTGMFLSPLNDEISIVSLTHVSSGSPNNEPYAQSLYNFAKKRVFTSPDPTQADLAFEKMMMAQFLTNNNNNEK